MPFIKPPCQHDLAKIIALCQSAKPEEKRLAEAVLALLGVPLERKD